MQLSLRVGVSTLQFYNCIESNIEYRSNYSARFSSMKFQAIKNPLSSGFRNLFVKAFRRCHRGAALPSMNELFIFLARFQHLLKNI